jgi:hypothetical protein
MTQAERQAQKQGGPTATVTEGPDPGHAVAGLTGEGWAAMIRRYQAL